MKLFIVSEVAEQLGANPRDISTAFYCRKLDPTRCQIVGGRRLIPESYIGEIARVLREAGKLQPA
jgi:hypothetical protein